MTPETIAALLAAIGEERLDLAALTMRLAEHPDLLAAVARAFADARHIQPGTQVFLGPVNVSGGHVGPGPHISVENLILGMVPRLDRRVYVVYDPADGSRVLEHVQELRGKGWDIPFDARATRPELLSPADLVALAEADEVRVFWSTAARRNARVEAEITRACALERGRVEGVVSGLLPRSSARPRLLIPTRLDDAPLPAPLARDLGRPSFGVGMAIAGTAGFWCWGSVAGWPLGWRQVLVAAFGLALLALAGAQAMRRGDRLLRAATVHRFGLLLNRAGVRDVLALSNRVLNWIFGDRILSWRSFRVSALLAAITIVPLAAISCGVFAAVKGEGALSSAAWFGLGIILTLPITIPIALVNVGMDFVAFGLGRALLRRVIDAPTTGRLVAGLLGEIGLVAGTASCVVGANPFSVVVAFSAHAIWAWPAAVWRTSLLALSGGVAWENLYRGYLTPILLLTAVAGLTSAFPAFVQGSLFLLALLNRVSGHRLLSLTGEALQRAADTPHGPWTLLAPAAVVPLALAFALWPPTPVPTTDLPETFVVIPLTQLCAKGCTLGSPADEPGRFKMETQRQVWFTRDILLMRMELTQARWATVWSAAGERVPDRWGLSEVPSIFVGSNLPVEGVSWCEAARFANLWSVVEGRQPAYCAGADCGPVSTAGPVPEGYGLPSCKGGGGPPTWNRSSDGYRLPTEAEWEVAARGGDRPGRWWTGPDEASLLKAEWLLPNAGWRTHPVGDPPYGGSHPLQLQDMLGNVSEWTWDIYVENPPGGIDPAVSAGEGDHVVRGGSWYNIPRSARSAFRYWDMPWLQNPFQGVRLVRPVP